MARTEPATSLRADIDAPLWDLRTFSGRLRHFFWVTDYRMCLLPTNRFYAARDIVQQCRAGALSADVTDAELRRAKQLCESAFHPDSGELQNVVGRMTFQVPGGMLITAGMLHFYKSNGAVLLWQWINQSFNALVNYTNRNAASQLTNRDLAIAYVTATSSAMGVALGLKKLMARSRSPLLQRFVPFMAVAAANMFNIPFTRQSELRDGIVCEDEKGNKVTQSKFAAGKAISQVTFSRITIAAPGMLLVPVVMQKLEPRHWFSTRPALHLPLQTFLVGACLTVMVPIGCALFPQRSSISVDRLSLLDGARLEALKERYHGNPPATLFFNKGL